MKFPKDDRKESIIQKRVVEWIRFVYPDVLFTIAPNLKLPVWVGRLLKAMGYLAGTPDLMILEPRGPWHGLYIELKNCKGKLSDNQRRVIERLTERDYMTVVCWGAEEAEAVIDSYMKGKK